MKGATAYERGQLSLSLTAEKHRPEITRLIPLVRDLARRRRVITTEDVRRAAGLLESDGRELAYLGALMKAAGLTRTGMYRRSELPISHGNLLACWELRP